MKRNALALVTLATAAAILLLIACNTGGGSTDSAGNGRSTGGPGTGTGTTALINTTLSDPTTCSAPQGPYSHIYVTITDVKISPIATAFDNDPSFVDLTPNLKNAPQQVDLLAVASNQCFLATLGTATTLPTGTYQQMRVFLMDNAAANKPAGNKCGNDANCVQLASDSSIHTLQLATEISAGITISSDQMGGGFTAKASATQNLNIDFDACASIVTLSDGKFRLQPSLHAGEVATGTSSITGTIVDKTTGAAIVGGKTIVALEQKDSTGVDRVVQLTVPDASGAFIFCPVPAGTYDVVAAAVNGAGVAYAATVTLGVQPGNALGFVPLVAQTGANTGPASLTGLVRTTTATSATVADVSISALQTIATSSTSTLSVTIPLAQQSSATVVVPTAATSAALTCPTNTDCASYTLSLPATAPSVGVFSVAGTAYTTSTAAATYIVQGHAFLPSSGGKDDCSPSIVSSTAVAVTPGNSFTVPNLNFTGCQ
jgi:hypothetical protein